MPKKVWLALLALVLATVVPASADEWSRHYALKGRPALQLRTGDGSVRVEPGQASSIEALVTTQGWKIGDGGVTITDSQVGDRVSIEVRVPGGVRLFDFGHRSVAIVVRVPREIDLDVKTGDGAIEVSPVSGTVSLSTGDGHIDAEGLKGEIHLHSGDGAIKGTALDGRLRADTGDGGMVVRGRFDMLDLHSGDGSIEAHVEQGSKVAEAWSLQSGDGSIVLQVPSDLAADLEAHTGDGHIDLDAPVTVSGTVSRSDVRGKLGAGGAPLRVHTGDGSIHVERSGR